VVCSTLVSLFVVFIISWGQIGYSIGQVRLIIQPYYPRKRGRSRAFKTIPNPEYLAYVQHFTYSHVTHEGWSGTPIPQVNQALNMYEVRRSNPPAGGVAKGDIIPLTSFWQPIQLIPKFTGAEADRSLDCNNVLEKSTAFYVNSFSDNQIYQTVY
jgi:hypothetical protein